MTIYTVNFYSLALYLYVVIPWWMTSSWKTRGRAWQRFMLKMCSVSFFITSGWNIVPSVPLNRRYTFDI